MKIIALFRDSVEAKYISNLLSENNMIDALVLEDRKVSNIRKVKRIFKKSKPWFYPIKILDIISIIFYSKYYNYKLSKDIRKEGYDKYPNCIPIYNVKEANCDNCISILKSFNPDIIIVLGTSILKEEVLSIPKKYLLNIHGGIVPEYRNVHSDFWAFLNRDYNHIGTSIIYLNKGIDSGDIALKSSIKIDPNDSLYEVKNKNLRLAADLIIEALNKSRKGTLEKIKQDKTKKGFYKTPDFVDIIKMIKDDNQKNEYKIVEVTGYLFGYLLFATILYSILVIFKKINLNYFHIIGLTLLIMILGVLIKRLLK